MSESTSRSRSLAPRRLEFDSHAEIRKHWFEDDAFRTHMLNAYTLLVPEGEKFIHRNVEHVESRVRDGQLKAQLQGFFAQELGHAGQHQRCYKLLERQGYRFRALLAGYKWFTYSFMERLAGRTLSLSVAAGLEHFNAMIAEIGLEKSDYFEGSDPELSRLMQWHFTEEIEHKAVVHEVLDHVSPGYFLRVIGGLFGYVLFALDLTMVAAWLGLQDGSLFSPKSWLSAFRYWFTRERVFFRMARGIAAYLRPRFHPDDHDNYHLVAANPAQLT